MITQKSIYPLISRHLARFDNYNLTRKNAGFDLYPQWMVAVGEIPGFSHLRRPGAPGEHGSKVISLSGKALTMKD
jgi:hypothetical protein